MDAIVDSLEKAYDDFLTATAIVLETRETNDGKKPEGVDPYLESFQQSLLSFQATCDKAQVFVEDLKHCLGCEEFPRNLSYSPEQVSDSDPIPIKIDDEKTLKTDMSTSKS